MEPEEPQPTKKEEVQIQPMEEEQKTFIDRVFKEVKVP